VRKKDLAARVILMPTYLGVWQIPRVSVVGLLAVPAAIAAGLAFSIRIAKSFGALSRLGTPIAVGTLCLRRLRHCSNGYRYRCLR
jgi:hypothetical protein